MNVCEFIINSHLCEKKNTDSTEAFRSGVSNFLRDKHE